MIQHEKWFEGFNAGVKKQQKHDIDVLVETLRGLEHIDGIGEKTAWKIREIFMEKFL